MAAEKTTKRMGRPPKNPEAKAESFSIRLVPELRARLQEAADREHRSLAAEIVWRLQESFEWELVDPTQHPEYSAQLQAFDEKVAAMESRMSDLQAMLEKMGGDARAGRGRKK